MSQLPRATGFTVAIRRGTPIPRSVPTERSGSLSIAMPELHVDVTYRDHVAVLRDVPHGRTLLLQGCVYNHETTRLLELFARASHDCAVYSTSLLDLVKAGDGLDPVGMA